MITVDLTMPLHILNILILIAVMNAVLYRPVRGILRKRKEEIATMENDIVNFEKNAKLRVEEFDQKLNEARSKAKEQFDGVKKEAQDVSNAKVAEIRKASDAQKAEELGKIKEQFVSADTALKAELDGFASAMASKILGRAVS
jgi:F-type H+-transporting ATPase subunit b